MRIRNMRPEFWADRQLAKQTTRDARLLYHGLWNLADEQGRAPGSPEYVKGQIFPYETDLDINDVDALLDELAAAGKVVRYVGSGDPFLYLPNLGKHNRLDPEKTPSKLPPPPDPDCAEPPLFDLLTESAPVPESFRNDSALRGRREKGLERRERAHDSARVPAPSPYCDKHQPTGTDKPCRACGHARERREAWEAQRRERQAREPPCPRHDGEISSNCRPCAAERKGRT